jgi:hypothetical protein
MPEKPENVKIMPEKSNLRSKNIKYSLLKSIFWPEFYKADI